MPEAADVPPRPRPRSQLLRRLPILIVVALGVLLWRAPFFPQERTLVFQLDPSLVSATRVDLQLYEPDGALIAREQRSFPHGAPQALELKVTLRQGRYRATVFLALPAPAPERSWSSDVNVGDEQTLVLPVR